MIWFINPFFVLSFFFAIGYSSTFLGWSDLFGDLNPTTHAIYVTVSVVFFIIGVLTFRSIRKSVFFSEIPPSSYDSLFFAIIVSFFLAECVYSGYIPFFLSNYSDVLEANFGIPVFHGLFISYLSYKSAYFFHQYLSSGRFRFLFFVFAINLISLFLMRRGMLVFNALAYIFMYIIYSCSGLSRQKFVKEKILVASVVILVLFGIVGNMRHGDETGDYILQVGKASQAFYDSGVPKVFYFAYMYLSSPVGIFDVNVSSSHEESISRFFLYNIVPDFLSKRFLPSNEQAFDFESVGGFTVGGLFVVPFIQFGLIGVFLILLYYCIISLMVLKTFFQKKKRAIIAMSLFLALTSLLTFSNLLNKGGYVLQVFFAMLFVDLPGSRGARSSLDHSQTRT